MEITTFELLVKPIAPPAPGNPAITAVARRVVQGYFLTITNLEDRNLRYRLDFTQSIPNPANPERSLQDNADLVVDIAGVNQVIPLQQSGNRFFARFDVPAGQTASAQLLPRLTPARLTNPTPDLEIRGFVSLALPALPAGTTGILRFIRVPQSETPVRVLLNPETRGTFLPNDFPVATTGDFDQINYAMAIATGQALNEVEPEPGGFIFIPGVLTNVLQSIDVFEPRFTNATDLEKTQAIVELFAQLDPSAENLQSLSDLFSKLEIPVRVAPVC